MNDNFAAATTMATRQIQQQAMLGTRSPLVNGALAAMQERGPLGLIFATTIRSGAPDPPRVVLKTEFWTRPMIVVLVEGSLRAVPDTAYLLIIFQCQKWN